MSELSEIYPDCPPEGALVVGRAAPLCGPCRFLISLDFDGTLRSKIGDPISKEFFELMAELRPMGVRWGINTGRNLPELIHEIGPCLHHMPDFICTCERYAYFTDEQGIVRPAVDNNVRCEDHNEALRAQHLAAVREGLAQMAAIHPNVVWRKDPLDEFSVIAADETSMDELFPFLQDLCAQLDGFSLQRAGRYVRFSDARYNKGTALECVVEAWGLADGQLFIMGDGHNDISAFKHYPKAFNACPLNAHQEVLDYAQEFGVYHSREKGVMEAIQHWRQQI